MTAAKILSRYKKSAEVTLINRFENMQFTPLLPDIVSRTIPTRYLIYPIHNLQHAYGFRFVRDEVLEIDLEKTTVKAEKEAYPYDYLIVAAGSETNFYGNPFKETVLKLDNIFDGERIADALWDREYDRYLISGCGYTGIEIAFHLRKRLIARNLKRPIFMIDASDTVLGPLPQWMKEYTLSNLKSWGIEIQLKTLVSGVEGSDVMLSTGETLRNTLLIWSAGMKAPGIVDRIETAKEAQGRIATDAALCFRENAFAVGNTGCAKIHGPCPRMSTQTAVRQGAHAAENIIRSIQRKALLDYDPIDFGYFIPMANWQSCGILFGKKIKGASATFLHYLISAYRVRGMVNKTGVMWHALTNRQPGKT